MSNQLAIVPFYLLSQSLVSQHSFDTDFNDAIQTPLVVPKLARDLPHGYTVFPDIGLAYKVHKKPMTWSNAQKYCAREGGHLALIDSFQKIEYTLGSVPKPTDISVGIHRLFNEDEWVEIKTGLPPADIPWRENPLTEDKSRKCAKIDVDRSGIYASGCNFTAFFVCEISI